MREEQKLGSAQALKFASQRRSERLVLGEGCTRIAYISPKCLSGYPLTTELFHCTLFECMNRADKGAHSLRLGP